VRPYGQHHQSKAKLKPKQTAAAEMPTTALPRRDQRSFLIF